eukprot:gene13523-15928_t
MKPIRLLTGLLAAATVVIASCSAPRLAQQGGHNDDVYNSVAQAQEYVQPQPSQASQYRDDSRSGDDYGTSDPYYDMDYSSRINRFYYGSPFRGYYDPYYYDGYYGYNSGWGLGSGWSVGLGFGWGWGSSYFGNYWNPYYGGWGIYSPYWAYNPYWGGGLWGGGWWGGGWGGGYYPSYRLPGTTTYGPRPNRSGERGYPSGSFNGYTGRGAIRTTNGIISSDRSRSERSNPNMGNYNQGNRGSNPYVNQRGRTESYNPPTRSERPSYTPPPSNNGGGGGGGGRSQRSGGRN